MALTRLILAALILASTGAGADAQLVGGRGIGGIGGLGSGGLGGLPSNVPVTTVPGGIATHAIPAVPLSNPVGAMTQPLSTVTPGVTGAIGNTASGVTQDVGAIAATAGRDLVGRPLNVTALARDPRGFPIVAGEVLAVSPSSESLAIARRLNFRVVRQDQLAALSLSTTVLAAPTGMDAIAALAALRQADPSGTYDYANIYNPSGGQSANSQAASGNTADLITPPSASPNTRIGMIDGGVEARHSAFSSTHIVSRSFADDGNTLATAHGTAIASLLAGTDRNFSGYAPGATVYAADVFGGEPSGGGAVEIALALNWLAESKIAVANISLAGPPNALLAAAVKAFVESGHVLVAASGNDGPAAPPNYPAAYPGVIGVTAIDTARHFALDANRNARFAALGVHVRAAALPNGYGAASGTSYASPLVAARFALLVDAPSKGVCQTALASLSREATPLSETGITYLAAPSGRVAAK
jgi:hypothetical protein